MQIVNTAREESVKGTLKRAELLGITDLKHPAQLAVGPIKLKWIHWLVYGPYWIVWIAKAILVTRHV